MNAKNVILLLWFIHVFRPDWLIAFYVPSLSIIRVSPKLILYLLALVFFVSSHNKKHDTVFFLFLLSVAVSTLFAANYGISKNILLQYVDYYIFLIICLTLVDNMEFLERMIKIFLAGFVFYAMFGIMGKGLVKFHPLLGDEDAFGPYMAMGVVIYYFLAFTGEKVNKKMLLAALLFVMGVVASFARGAMIGLVSGMFYIWWKSKRKISMALAVGMVFLIVLVSAVIFFEEGKYIEEMQSISEVNPENEGRIFYWTKAMDIFYDNPLVGVGPRNYGVVLPEYVTEEESASWGRFSGFWYGRVPHSVYFQLIAEQGALGVLLFAALLKTFFKRAKLVENECKEKGTPREKKLFYYALGIKSAMIIYLITGAFYDFLHAEWFFQLFLLNMLVFSLNTQSGDKETETKSTAVTGNYPHTQN